MSIQLELSEICNTDAYYIALAEWDVIIDGMEMPFKIYSTMNGYRHGKRARRYAQEPYGYNLVRGIAFAIALRPEAIEFFNCMASVLWGDGSEHVVFACARHEGLNVCTYKPARCSREFRFFTESENPKNIFQGVQYLDAMLSLFESMIWLAEEQFPAIAVLQIMEVILKEIYSSPLWNPS